MFAKPQHEHEWLSQLVGSWTTDSECQMGPDQPPQKSKGTLEIRSLGGLWVLAEGGGYGPDSDRWTTIMTLGFDPAINRYVGTFIGSMMASLWIYNGALDPNQKRLVLDTVGPKFDGSGNAAYQDIVEIVDADQWILSSQIQSDTEEWIPFMKVVHRRIQ